MEKFKICPGCGFHNIPLAIECEECGEDLSTVRILDSQTEEQLKAQETNVEQITSSRMVRICEECGVKNEANSRKCVSCGEDISMVIPIPDEDGEKVFSLASLDGEFTYQISQENPVVIGRENEMQDYLKDKFYVSRKHAELSVKQDKLYVKSLSNAINGTHINSVTILPNEEIELNVGDIVGLGGNNPDNQKEAAYFKVIKS